MYIDGSAFKDNAGRTLLLRGINLSGSSKLPTSPPGGTYNLEGFYEHRDVSFVGRPFPLDEADEHFGRLRAWGLTFLRFLVPWEAVEHTGPGHYDTAYLEYLRAILEKANAYGIHVMIDPHQDAWSRWTGGDGAPGWTLEAFGIDLTKLHRTGAAITQQESADDYPRMIWPTNYNKYGAATMFTLFFAGDDLAPKTQIDGVGARTFLQTHYINAFRKVAETVGDLPNVVGYDTMNEPIRGFIETRDLSRDEPHGLLTLGASPTPLQTMALASGHTLKVRNYAVRPWGPQMTGWITVNPNGESVWREGFECVWKTNGVWTDAGGSPRSLRPYYFAQRDGHKINFVEDYLKPFMVRFTKGIRRAQPKAIVFIEGVPNLVHPKWTADDPPNVAYGGHWYDNATLFLKFFRRFLNADISPRGIRFVFGQRNVQDMFTRQLRDIKASAVEHMNGMPALIGEFGVPFDFNGGTSLTSGDFSTQTTALDMYYNALDTNLLSATLWNYTPDNTNVHGDHWNEENLSIFSRDQQHKPDDINSGGRGLAAVVRPYPVATAGNPLQMRFDLETRTFTYRWCPDRDIDAPTVIFMPRLHYRKSYLVEGNRGLRFAPYPQKQELHIRLGDEFVDEVAEITVTVDPKNGS